MLDVVILQIKGSFCSENVVVYIFTLDPNTEGLGGLLTVGLVID